MEFLPSECMDCPAQAGHPFPCVRLLGVATHSFEHDEHIQWIFLTEPNVTVSGVSGAFLSMSNSSVRCGWVSLSFLFAAKSSPSARSLLRVVRRMDPAVVRVRTRCQLAPGTHPVDGLCLAPVTLTPGLRLGLWLGLRF